MSMPTLSEETWRFLVVYEHHAGTRINLQALEKASGLAYKTLWGKMDKAKKSLKAEGFDFDSAAEATPKATPKKAATGSKRKAKFEDGDDAEAEASPTKKGKKDAVKVKNEIKDEDETE